MLQSANMENGASPESVLEASFGCPTVIHMSPLLNTPEIQALVTKNPKLFKTAEIFAYGTVEDLDDDIPPAWLHKLRQLSLISYATQNRQLSYDELLKRLRLSSTRELEDVVIDAIYHGMVKGRLDSSNRVVFISDWMARDVPSISNILPRMVSVLNGWLQHASKTQSEALSAAEKENALMSDEIELKKKTETEVQNARQNVEDLMNRSHDIGPTTSETTPRTKRRPFIPNRSKK